MLFSYFTFQLGHLSIIYTLFPLKCIMTKKWGWPYIKFCLINRVLVNHTWPLSQNSVNSRVGKSSINILYNNIHCIKYNLVYILLTK